jgi:hypothetical protein
MVDLMSKKLGNVEKTGPKYEIVRPKKLPLPLVDAHRDELKGRAIKRNIGRGREDREQEEG